MGLARDAKKAARAAAKELGEPAIATEFEPTKLYGPSKAKKAEAAPQQPASPPADPNKP